jgi:hypothetical protein
MSVRYWTAEDDETVLRTDIGTRRKALLLNRTYGAVITRRSTLRARGQCVPRTYFWEAR